MSDKNTSIKNGQLYLQNILAAVTVSFVALSLGAAFGLLSGRGAFAGMLSAAIIAIITSAFGGTRVQCSGPTGPMTAVTATLVALAYDSLGVNMPGVNPDHFINLTLYLTAILLVVFSILRLGKYITLVPNVVISGFMNGIAVIIWFDQINRVFGTGGKEALAGPLWQNIFLLVLSAILVFTLPSVFRKFMPKIASLLSGTFVTLILATGFSILMNFDVQTVSLGATINSWKDVVALLQSQVPSSSIFTWEVIKVALPFALQLAILAYLDTLMTSLIVDKMTGETTKADKELAAQGLATAGVALVGGIPGAQATIRSVLLVKEKATMRAAGVLVGVLAFVEMIVFQDVIGLIPEAVFAGILIKVGYDVFDWLPLRLYVKELSMKPVQMMRDWLSRHDDEPIFVTNREVVVILGTTVATVAWNLNAAVGIFTALFYAHNYLFSKSNPMRDLKPVLETEAFSDEQ